MINDTFYDIAIIGGGISSCVFSSFHLKNGYQGRIAIIENGRNLGGRSSTRNSISNSASVSYTHLTLPTTPYV